MCQESAKETGILKKNNEWLAKRCKDHEKDHSQVESAFTEFKEKYKILHCDYELLKEDYRYNQFCLIILYLILRIF